MSGDPVSASGFQGIRGDTEEAPAVVLPRVQATVTGQATPVYYGAEHIIQEPAHPGPPILSTRADSSDSEDDRQAPVPLPLQVDRGVEKLGNQCKYEGCQKVRLKGGYCSQHGGGRKCEVDGCTKGAAGATRFCIAHGGGKRCNEPDCNKLVRKQGYCIDHCKNHGIEVGMKLCLEADCVKQAYRKGYCCHHARQHGFYEGGGVGMCKAPNCTKYSQKQGYCKAHGKENGVTFVSRKNCKVDDCDLIAERKGYCLKHIRELGIDNKFRKCKMDGCDKLQMSRGHGYCTAHAKERCVVVPDAPPRKNILDHVCQEEGCEIAIVSSKMYCKVHNRERNLSEHARCGHPGCDKQQQKGTGFCIHHARESGLSIDYSRCKESGCYKYVYRKGFCIAHGREHGIEIDHLYKRCEEIDCRKFSAKGLSYCKAHAKERGLNVFSSTRECNVEGCNKSSQKGGLCRAHGREAGLVMEYKRCEYGDCDKHITKRVGGKGYCTLHAREVALALPAYAPDPEEQLPVEVTVVEQEVVMQPLTEEPPEMNY